MIQPVNKDIYYSTTGTDYRFRIVVDDVIVYEGKAYAKPNTENIEINVSRICRNYLKNELSVIEEENIEYTHPEALKHFVLMGYDKTTDEWGVAEEYDFLWYYDDEEITSNLSVPINKHSVVGARNLKTTYDAVNGVKTSVKTSDEVVGCEYRQEEEGGGGDPVPDPPSPPDPPTPPSPTADTKDYLTFHIRTDGTIVWEALQDNIFTAVTRTVQYSKNGGPWTNITSSFYPGTSFNVSAGDVIKWRGNNVTSEYNCFLGTALYDVSGNIMSLLNPTDFENMTSFPSNQTQLAGLFYGGNVVDASELILPAKTLTPSCYYYMFADNTNLTKAPKLPATNLAENCYNGMFFNCHNLTTAPTLPATTLARSCYAYMFANTGSYYGNLTQAPTLPARNLADSCYNAMFAGQRILTTAPALPATTLKQSCYQQMFLNCSNLVNAPALPATTLPEDGRCYRQMFQNCTSLVNAPELPAKTLTDYSYYGMFSGCSNLNYIKCLATDRSAYNCTRYWVVEVADSGTFVKDADMTGWATDSVNGIPVGWTVQNDDGTQPDPDEREYYKQQYLTFKIQSDGDIKWYKTLDSVVRTIQYRKNGGSWNDLTATSGGTTLSVVSGDTVEFKGDNNCYGIANFASSTCGFEVNGNIMSLINSSNFANLIDLPDGPWGTFGDMFASCTGLTDAHNLVLPALTLKESCYSGMFANCSSLTKAPVLPATNLARRCYDQMFGNCTSLANAPVLPATDLSTECYYFMFVGCTSLVATPELPATNLADGCYMGMFEGCTSLTTVPTVLPAFRLYKECYMQMFMGCTSLVTAPELPADYLVNGCYQNMFYGCSSLNYVKCTARDISAPLCTANWLAGVAVEGTFVKSPNADWARGSNGVPSTWVIEDLGSNNRMLRSAPLLRDYVVMTEGDVNGYVVCYCGDYVLYYQNRKGGWDTFLFEGKCRQIDVYDIHKYKKIYNNNTIEFSSKRYLNAITERWELNSGWLTEMQAAKFAKHLLSTNRAYLHIINGDRIIPVNIINAEAEYKKYNDNGGLAPINYTITVENSQEKDRK